MVLLREAVGKAAFKTYNVSFCTVPLLEGLTCIKFHVKELFEPKFANIETVFVGIHSSH